MTTKQKLRKDTVKHLKALLEHRVIEKRKLNLAEKSKSVNDVSQWKFDYKQNARSISYLKYAIKVLTV